MSAIAHLAKGKRTVALVFDAHARQALEERTGRSIVEVMEKIKSSMSFTNVRLLVWAGLRTHHRALDLTAAGTIIDGAGGPIAILDKLFNGNGKRLIKVQQRKATMTTIEANGKTYKLSFSVNAMCELEGAMDNKPFHQIFSDMSAPEQFSMNNLRLLVWAGLRDHHPDIDLKGAGDIIVAAGGVLTVTETITAALLASHVSARQAASA